MRLLKCYHMKIHSTNTLRLVNYTPPAVIIRLLTINYLIAYLTTWILYLSGASSDPRLLLPAWISITSVRLYCKTPTHVFTHLFNPYYATIDSYTPVPPNSTQDQHQERNQSFTIGLLHCKLHKYVVGVATTAFISRKWARDTSFRHDTEGLECQYAVDDRAKNWILSGGTSFRYIPVLASTI